MEKRVIVFLVLSLGIIFGYEYLLKELGLLPEPTISEPAEPSVSETPPSSTSSGSPASSAPATKEPASLTPSGRAAEVQEPRREATATEFIEVETDLYRAKFTTRGAALRAGNSNAIAAVPMESPSCNSYDSAASLPSP